MRLTASIVAMAAVIGMSIAAPAQAGGCHIEYFPIKHKVCNGNGYGQIGPKLPLKAWSRR